MDECGCGAPCELKPARFPRPDDKWEFSVLEDGGDKGYNFLIMRAVHPVHGSIIRMWGWIPSKKEIETFKKNTIAGD
jgi:hypothetical protein